jgi:hypothetical protein
LNSVYDETLGCCIQYLQCIQCKNDTVIGARVLLADSTSQYTAGQVLVLFYIKINNKILTGQNLVFLTRFFIILYLMSLSVIELTSHVWKLFR